MAVEASRVPGLPPPGVHADGMPGPLEETKSPTRAWLASKLPEQKQAEESERSG